MHNIEFRINAWAATTRKANPTVFEYFSKLNLNFNKTPFEIPCNFDSTPYFPFQRLNTA